MIKSSVPNDATKWDDGEIPWDVQKDDNGTTVKVLPPFGPIAPLRFEQQQNRILCALIE
jgi:hypothetical protein